MDVEAFKEKHSNLKRKADTVINELVSNAKTSSAKRRNIMQKLRNIDLYKSIIKTYKAPVWYGCAVSPRDLADFGWSCIKKDTVKCIECDQILSTLLPNITEVTVNVYNKCLKHIHEKMVTAHKVTCCRRVCAPPFKLCDRNNEEILKGITARLPTASSLTGKDLSVDVPSDVILPNIKNSEPPFIFCAALGWKLTKYRRGYILLNCELCARELILKFGSKFDPIHNHERWCPCVDKDDHGEPVWQTDLNKLLNTKNKTQSTSYTQLYKDYYAVQRILSNTVSSPPTVPPSITNL